MNLTDFTLEKTLLYDDSPCGCLSFDADGKILQVNKILLTWLGYNEDDIARKRINELFTVGGRLYYYMVLLPLILRQGQVSEINFDIVTADGDFFPCLFNAVKVNYSGVEVINAVILKIDDRKKLELNLQKAKHAAEEEIRRFEILSKVIPNPIFTISPIGVINFANKCFYDEFPELSINLGRKDIYKSIHPQHRRLLTNGFKIAIKSVEPFEAEIRFKNHSRKYCWYLIKIIPYQDISESGNAWLGSFTNIHIQKTKLLKELKALNTSLTEAEYRINDNIRTLNEISYSQSHRVRRPLANILGLLSLIDTNDDLMYINKVILPMINQSALELDDVIKSTIDA